MRRRGLVLVRLPPPANPTPPPPGRDPPPPARGPPPPRAGRAGPSARGGAPAGQGVRPEPDPASGSRVIIERFEGTVTFRFTTAGESHGRGLVAILEGIPAGLPVSAERINADLKRRLGRYGRGARMKIEADQIEWLAGVR